MFITQELVKFIKNCSAEQGSCKKVESEISSSDFQKQDERNSHSEGTGDSIGVEKDVKLGESEAFRGMMRLGMNLLTLL